MRAVVFLIRCPEEPYHLTQEDVVLFHHPNVKRLRLHGVNFAVFAKSPASVTRHEKLQDLAIEESDYTVKAFQQLFTPSTSLEKLTMNDDRCFPQRYETYSVLLTHAAATLKSLTLLWMGRSCNARGGKHAMIFSNFTALRFLAIDPGFILGRPLPTDGDEESREAAAQLVARRLPPNIKVLSLAGLVLPYACPIQTEEFPMSQVFPAWAEMLLQVLIEQKQTRPTRVPTSVGGLWSW